MFDAQAPIDPATGRPFEEEGEEEEGEDEGELPRSRSCVVA